MMNERTTAASLHPIRQRLVRLIQRAAFLGLLFAASGCATSPPAEAEQDAMWRPSVIAAEEISHEILEGEGSLNPRPWRVLTSYRAANGDVCTALGDVIAQATNDGWSMYSGVVSSSVATIPDSAIASSWYGEVRPVGPSHARLTITLSQPRAEVMLT